MWTVTTSAFFVWSQLFSSVTANKATIVPVQYMYTQIFGAGNAVTDRNAGYAAAIGIILCLCVVLIFTVCNALLKDDNLEFSEGGVVVAKEKEKKVREKINWKKEAKLAPGYIIIIAWVVFTLVLLGWIVAASLSTTKEIFAGEVLKFGSGLHFENYIAAWVPAV